MGTTDDDIDKFTTVFHDPNFEKVIAQRIFIPVCIIIHLNADDRNKCDNLLGQECLQIFI